MKGSPVRIRASACQGVAANALNSHPSSGAAQPADSRLLGQNGVPGSPFEVCPGCSRLRLAEGVSPPHATEEPRTQLELPFDDEPSPEASSPGYLTIAEAAERVR